MDVHIFEANGFQGNPVESEGTYLLVFWYKVPQFLNLMANDYLIQLMRSFNNNISFDLYN